MDTTPRYGDCDNTLLFKIAESLNAGGGGGGGGVLSFNTRTGAVTLTSGDVTTALGFTPVDGSAYVLKSGDNMSGALTFATNKISLNADGSASFGTGTFTIGTGGAVAIATNKILLNADGSASFAAAVTASSFRVDSTNVNAQTGTSYQLDATDNGKVVTLDNTNPIALTVPSGLGAGFSCTIIQINTGQVTVGVSGTTVNSYTSLVKLAGQHAAATLYAYAADVFNLSGNLSA